MDETQDYVDEMISEMDKPIGHLRSEFSKVRTGRASLAVLDDIKVEYYGQRTALSGVASLSVPEPRMIIVKPWDPSMLAEIEKAIRGSSLGITPANDGKIIRLVFPELTEERRKQLVKDIQKSGESAKIGVRNVRREYNKLFQQMAKDGDISEDASKRAVDEVQVQTDRHCAKVDDIVKKKEAEILEI